MPAVVLLAYIRVVRPVVSTDALIYGKFEFRINSVRLRFAVLKYCPQQFVLYSDICSSILFRLSMTCVQSRTESDEMVVTNMMLCIHVFVSFV